MSNARRRGILLAVVIATGVMFVLLPVLRAGMVNAESAANVAVLFIEADYTIELKRAPGVNVEARAEATLADVAQALEDKTLLFEEYDNVWLLRARILVREGVTLIISGDEVKLLKLESNPGYYEWIENSGGTIIIRGTKITSWDSFSGSVDAVTSDGRSFILTTGGRTDIFGADLSYLGYDDKDRSGVSWSAPATGTVTGIVRDSVFSYNRGGVFSSGSQGMQFVNNEFHHNVSYGLVIRDIASKGTAVEGNRVYENGGSGLTLFLAANITIKDNVIYGHKEDGIQLLNQSDNNLIEGNTVYGNDMGVQVRTSHYNTIRRNMIHNNRKSGIFITRLAAGNVIEGNIIYQNIGGGVRLTEARKSVVSKNTISGNPYGGVRISTHSTGTYIEKNKFARNDNGNIVIFAEGVGDVNWRSGPLFKLKKLYLFLLNYI